MTVDPSLEVTSTRSLSPSAINLKVKGSTCNSVKEICNQYCRRRNLGFCFMLVSNFGLLSLSNCSLSIHSFTLISPLFTEITRLSTICTIKNHPYLFFRLTILMSSHYESFDSRPTSQNYISDSPQIHDATTNLQDSSEIFLNDKIDSFSSFQFVGICAMVDPNLYCYSYIIRSTVVKTETVKYTKPRNEYSKEVQ